MRSRVLGTASSNRNRKWIVVQFMGVSSPTRVLAGVGVGEAGCAEQGLSETRTLPGDWSHI